MTVVPVDARDITTWDVEADVVIAGYGIAGVSAAIEAARAGAEVVVLERTGGWGGAASLAGGFVYLGGGTPDSKACGFEDSVDNMRTFLCAAMGPGADVDRITDYCAGSLEHFDWLVDCGVPFKPSFWGEPGWEPPDDDGLMYTGGENAFPYNTIAVPAPRGHVPQMQDKRTGEKGGGYMLMKPLVDTATALGRAQHRRYPGAAARRRDATGGSPGSSPASTAPRWRCGHAAESSWPLAVSPTTSRWWRATRRGSPAGPLPRSKRTTASAIQMAQALGADLAHMDATEVAFLVDPQLVVRGILVNGRGQRYVAEDTYPGRIGQLTLYHQDDTAFLVLDADAHEQAMATRSATPFLLRPPTWVCETVAELEAEIGAADRLPADHGRGLQRGRRARRRPAAAQEARMATTDRHAGRRHRPARKHRRFHARRAAHVAVRRGPACQRRTDPGSVRGRTGDRRVSPPGATPAASRWATAVSTAAAPDGPPPLPDSPRIAGAPSLHPLTVMLVTGATLWYQ